MNIRQLVEFVCVVGIFKGDQARAEEYQNLLDPLLKETDDGRLMTVCSSLMHTSLVLAECIRQDNVDKLDPLACVSRKSTRYVLR